VAPWSDARVWDAMESHRWYPPSSRRVTAENYELAVTPGSSGLTWIYGFRARGASEAERLLREIRAKVRALGGTGARMWVTPHAQPPDLADLLSRFEFAPKESAEVLVYDLRDGSGNGAVPPFRPVPGLTVRETTSREDYDAVQSVTTTVFGLPTPPAAAEAGFVELYERQIRETGHSGRFLAVDGERAAGAAGLALEGPVAFLWGTGVLAEHRGRGIYGALVDARCRTAIDQGAEIALVIAQTGTSGPILKRHGFRVVGPIRTYEAQWTPEAAAP
jgi:GNAT superfamily N-acetyltransferase